MTRPRFVGGAMLAALAAAPLFAVAMAAEVLLSAPAPSVRQLMETVAVVMLVWPFAFVIALLPAIAGAAVLADYGKRQRWARNPLAWAAAGFLIGGTVGGLLLGQPPAGRPFAIAGALAALLARWRTAWPGVSLPAVPHG